MECMYKYEQTISTFIWLIVNNIQIENNSDEHI